MKRTEFCDKLKAFAEELGYRVEYKEDVIVRDGFYLRIYHNSMKLPTFNNEVLCMAQDCTDGDVSCWNFTFENNIDWNAKYCKINKKQLNNLIQYLTNFDYNWKQIILKTKLYSLKEDFV